jgi:hypothetical protein
VSASFADHEDALGGCAIIAALAVAAFFHENHFVLLLVITVLLYSVATLGSMCSSAMPAFSISPARRFSASAHTHRRC